jgi:hypothetical protein
MKARATGSKQAGDRETRRDERCAELTEALALPGLSDETRRRLEVALAVQGGQPGYKVSVEHGLSPNTAYLWAGRYEKGGLPALLGKHSLPSPQEAFWRQELVQGLATSALTATERRRLEAAHDVVVLGLRQVEVESKRGVSHKSLCDWLKAYHTGGPQALARSPIISTRHLRLIEGVDAVVTDAGLAGQLKAHMLGLLDDEEQEAKEGSPHILAPTVPLGKHALGTLGETLVRAYLIARGHQAEHAAGHSAYDLVIDTHTGEPPFRVQVKTTRRPGGPGRHNGGRTPSYDFRLHPGQQTATKYDPKDIDIYACVALDGPLIAFLAADEVGTSVKFRQPGVTYEDNGGLGREFADYPLERAMELVREKWRKMLSGGS